VCAQETDTLLGSDEAATGAVWTVIDKVASAQKTTLGWAG